MQLCGHSCAAMDLVFKICFPVLQIMLYFHKFVTSILLSVIESIISNARYLVALDMQPQRYLALIRALNPFS